MVYYYHKTINIVFNIKNMREIEMYIINKDECISCGACKNVCPVDAIVEKESKYEIIKEKCIECGACAGVCPVNAISE